MSKNPKSWFEPWEALQSLSVKEAPNVDGFPEDIAQAVLEMHSKSQKEAAWFLWGSGMTESARVHAPSTGSHSMTSGRQIIAMKRVVSDKEDAPTTEEIMKRIAECVNALAGIADPVTFIESVRSLLLDCCENAQLDASEDLRFASLLSRCIPLDKRSIT